MVCSGLLGYFTRLEDFNKVYPQVTAKIDENGNKNNETDNLGGFDILVR